MKVKNKDKIRLEEYIPHSKKVRMGILWIYDMAMVWLCSLLSLVIRFDFDISAIPAEYMGALWKYGLMQTGVVTFVFYISHLYTILWGAAGIREMLEVSLSCMAAAIAQPLAMTFLGERMPRSYFVLWLILMTIAAVCGRISYQVVQRILNRLIRIKEKETIPHVMIVGGGRAGTLILREMKSSEKVHGYPACIVDANHSNSNKLHMEQIRIVKEVLHSRTHSDEVKNLVKGVMIESYIEGGCQKVGGHLYGQSITDPCLSWEDSERLLLEIADRV